MDSGTATIDVRHEPEVHRYALVDGDQVIGEARYLPFAAATGDVRIFFHTAVDEAYGGQGLAARLATGALEDTVAAGLPIVPVCPYIRAFLPRHPDLAAHAVPVAREHLAALRRE